MTIKKLLKDVVAVVIDEAQKNPEFAQKLMAAAGWSEVTQGINQPAKQRRGRRTPAVLDPVILYGESGEVLLRERLQTLDIEQLRDIVAECGMDPGKLVMKWKTKERVINHIVEMASARSKKGDAFR